MATGRYSHERVCDVYQLKKALLYGLKQTPRAWTKNIDNKLKKMGFKSMINESCLRHRVYKVLLN